MKQTYFSRLAALMFVCLIATAAANGQVLSNSPDDVPPGEDAWIVTYQDVMTRTRPNHQVAFVQTGPNEQKVWFTFDVHLIVPAGTPTPTAAYYNRRYRANESSPWYWEYQYSPRITNITGFIDSVLYSATPKYRGPGGVKYNYVMYTVNQPAACSGIQFGFAMVAFSNNGTSWTYSQPIHTEGGPSAPCAPELGDGLVQTEAFGAIDAGGILYLMGVEGDIGILSQPINMNSPFVSWGYSYADDPTQLIQDPNSNTMSGAGIFNPALPGAPTSPTNRFRTYAYFFNMGIAWDAANGDLYVSRGYPYPFDRRADLGATIPSPAQTANDIRLFNTYWGWDQRVERCAPSPEIYPNRYQVYKLHLGTLTNFPLVNTGTWTLVMDRGNYAGYTQNVVAPLGSNAVLASGQTAGSRDAGATSFLRDGKGFLVRTNGTAYVFGGSTLHQSLSVGPCRTTGLERIVAEPIP